MSTATLAPPVASAASAPVCRIPTRTQIRQWVLNQVARGDIGRDVAMHMLASKPSIPCRLDLDEVLQGLKALEIADSLLDDEALKDLHLMLSEILSGATGKPRYNLRTGRFERKQKVVVNQWGDTRLQWVPCAG
jgi:hypothetical protein